MSSRTLSKRSSTRSGASTHSSRSRFNRITAISTFELTSEHIKLLLKNEEELESPINLTLEILTPITLTKLLWYNVTAKPIKTKITNNGFSLFYTSKWKNKCTPYLNGGPLLDDYIFYNIHFNWSSTEYENDVESSEHLVNGETMPFEMQVLWRKREYKNAKVAKKYADGIAIMCYLFHLSKKDNPQIQFIVERLKEMRVVDTTVKMCKLQSVSELLNKFEDDYIVYSGCVRDCVRAHHIVWIICRETQPISKEQILEFKLLKNKEKTPIRGNSRRVVPVGPRNVFLVAFPPIDLNFVLKPFDLEESIPPIERKVSRVHRVTLESDQPFARAVYNDSTSDDQFNGSGTIMDTSTSSETKNNLNDKSSDSEIISVTTWSTDSVSKT